MEQFDRYRTSIGEQVGMSYTIQQSSYLPKSRGLNSAHTERVLFPSYAYSMVEAIPVEIDSPSIFGTKLYCIGARYCLLERVLLLA